MVLNLSCPAVSQIYTFTYFPSRLIVFILKSIPKYQKLNDEQFDNIDEMCTFSAQNGFWELLNEGTPFEPYIPETDDPILRGEVGP